MGILNKFLRKSSDEDVKDADAGESQQPPARAAAAPKSTTPKRTATSSSTSSAHKSSANGAAQTAQKPAQKPAPKPATKTERPPRARAVIVGVGYFEELPAEKWATRNASPYRHIHGAYRLHKLLTEKYGYNPSEIRLLTDDPPRLAKNPNGKPTAANIRKSMDWLVHNAREGDSLFFFFGGHGGHRPQAAGKEDDVTGGSQFLVPCDSSERDALPQGAKAYPEILPGLRDKGRGKHIIFDDEIFMRLTQPGGEPLAEGVRVVSFIMSCHSGSMLNLPYFYNSEGRQIKQPAPKEMMERYSEEELDAMRRTAIEANTCKAEILQISAASDDESAWCHSVTNEKAMLSIPMIAFLDALNGNPHMSYTDLLTAMRIEIATLTKDHVAEQTRAHAEKKKNANDKFNAAVAKWVREGRKPGKYPKPVKDNWKPPKAYVSKPLLSTGSKMNLHNMPVYLGLGPSTNK